MLCITYHSVSEMDVGIKLNEITFELFWLFIEWLWKWISNDNASSIKSNLKRHKHYSTQPKLILKIELSNVYIPFYSDTSHFITQFVKKFVFKYKIKIIWQWYTFKQVNHFTSVAYPLSTNITVCFGKFRGTASPMCPNVTLRSTSCAFTTYTILYT